MRDSERNDFAAMLHDVAAYYDRKLAPRVIGLYWAGLSDLDLATVRAALNAHMQDAGAGQYMPKIADIRRQIESARDDGHPGPDEAWSIALQARHEDSSVVWTDQIAQAFFAAAMPLLDAGDKIAARKAFLERYEHDLADARKAGIGAKWIASLGNDPQQRAAVLDAAVRQNRLTAEQARPLLPQSEQIAPSAMRALESGIKAKSASPEVARQQLAALRAMLRIG